MAANADGPMVKLDISTEETFLRYSHYGLPESVLVCILHFIFGLVLNFNKSYNSKEEIKKVEHGFRKNMNLDSYFSELKQPSMNFLTSNHLVFLNVYLFYKNI
jgi:hypothetical protein